MPSTTTVSISEKPVNLTDIIQRTTRAHTAVVLNDHGKDVAVLLKITDYQQQKEENSFLKAVAQELIEAKEGKLTHLDDIKKKLGIAN